MAKLEARYAIAYSLGKVKLVKALNALSDVRLNAVQSRVFNRMASTGVRPGSPFIAATEAAMYINHT
jgi:hypothetical protein